MASPLSSLTDYIAESLLKGKCKDFKSSCECITVKDGLLTFKCVKCSKTYEKKLIKIYLRDSKTRISSVMDTLTNSVLHC